MLGAIAGSRKCWLACKPAMTSPPREKSNVAIKFKRIKLATRFCWAGVNPGAIPKPPRTNWGARIATMMEIAAVTRKTRLAMRENKSQAAGLPSFWRYSDRTGMKAIASAPPEIKAKIRSGILLAALKASNSLDNPKARAMRTWRINPRIFSTPKKNAMRRVERARCDM